MDWLSRQLVWAGVVDVCSNSTSTSTSISNTIPRSRTEITSTALPQTVPDARAPVPVDHSRPYCPIGSSALSAVSALNSTCVSPCRQYSTADTSSSAMSTHPVSSSSTHSNPNTNFDRHSPHVLPAPLNDHSYNQTVTSSHHQNCQNSSQDGARTPASHVNACHSSSPRGSIQSRYVVVSDFELFRLGEFRCCCGDHTERNTVGPLRPRLLV